MSEQYFTASPESKSKPVHCDFSYRGNALTFVTDAGVFSRGEVDTGTRILLEALPEEMSGRAIDLGCGWGAVGVSVGKACPQLDVVLSDVNERALGLSKENLKANGVRGECVLSDGFAQVSGAFDYVFTNPPIRAGKQVIYRLFQEAAGRLGKNGKLYLVIRKQQGAQSAVAYLSGIFSQVDIIDRSGGFWVIRCRGEKNEQPV